MQASNITTVKKAIIIGPTRETMTIGSAIKSIANRSIQVEKILTVVPPSDRKLERSELLPKLIVNLKGSDSSTMVITDFGDSRPYKCEEIATDVKANSNNAAVVLLTSKPECVGKPEKFADLVASRGFDPNIILPKIDHVFQYTGVDALFPMMLEVHEDRINYKSGNERAILVFESKPNYYSGYLTKLYEINQQRTSMLLARTFEEAAGIINDVKQKFAGAILGMRNPDDSFRLLRLLRAYNKGLPVIMQSGNPERLEMARKEGSVSVLDKNHPTLFYSLGNIVSDYFGFGDFIFRTPDGMEIGRARDLKELCDMISQLDGKSLVGHASRNDFSNWLYLHGYKEAADTVKPMFTEDSELLRSILISDLTQFVK